MRTIGKMPGVLQLSDPSAQIVSGPITFTDTLTISGNVTFTGDLTDNKVPQFDLLKTVSLTDTVSAANPTLVLNKTVADIFYQPLKTSLTAIGTITPAADKLPYFTGTSTATITTITGIGRDVISQTSVANLMSYLADSVGKIWTINNDGHTSGLDADTLDGVHLQGSSGNTDFTNSIPRISGGVLEIGRYIDFHNASGNDYDVRLETGGTTSSLYLNGSRLLTAGNYNEYAPSLAQYDAVVANANSRVLKSGDTMTGNLKIRNAVPSVSLVDRTHYASASLSNQGGRFRIFSDVLATGVYDANGTYDYDFNLNNTSSYITLMDLDIAGANLGTVVFKGDVCAFSDIRLKENIREIESPLSLVKKLTGVRFDWKDTKKSSVGLIAQNVEEVFPELVYTNAEGVKSVAYDKLVAVLIEAIKELAK